MFLFQVFGLGPSEILLVVLVVVLLVLGPKKLPELARAIGKSFGEVKKGMKETEEEEGKKKAGKGRS
jgi:TatA/E family protein of Tat protein translocase